MSRAETVVAAAAALFYAAALLAAYLGVLADRPLEEIFHEGSNINNMVDASPWKYAAVASLTVATGLTFAAVLLRRSR